MSVTFPVTYQTPAFSPRQKSWRKHSSLDPHRPARHSYSSCHQHSASATACSWKQAAGCSSSSHSISKISRRGYQHPQLDCGSRFLYASSVKWALFDGSMLDQIYSQSDPADQRIIFFLADMGKGGKGKGQQQGNWFQKNMYSSGNGGNGGNYGNGNKENQGWVWNAFRCNLYAMGCTVLAMFLATATWGSKTGQS